MACNAPVILSPFSLFNLIILTSILVTSVLHPWYCLALAVTVSIGVPQDGIGVKVGVSVQDFAIAKGTFVKSPTDEIGAGVGGRSVSCGLSD